MLNVTCRVLELQENGLFNYWDLWFRPMPPQCMDNIRSGDRYYKPSGDNKDHTPLSLKNLTGAFIVLFVGMSLSVIAFFYELMTSKNAKNSNEIK